MMAVEKLVVCPDGLIAALVGRERYAKVALCSLRSFSFPLTLDKVGTNQNFQLPNKHA
ncbi:hypothetical protein ACP70R_044058 [Stipagrostis hirtigluma subsp. patula]